MKMKLEMKGIDAMQLRLAAFIPQMRRLIADAMEAHAEVDVKEAKKRSPVYTGPPGPSKPIPGVLRDSIHAEEAVIRGSQISVEIVAGGKAGAYAIPQHENLTYRHTIGQAKYIESVILEGRASKARRIATRIDISKLKL